MPAAGLKRKGSQEDFNRGDPNDLQQVSTMESPRQNQSFEMGRGDFREEFQINPRAPFRGARPRSNNMQVP